MRFLEGIPDVLYKYRDWNNNFHKRLLFENELYFPSANQFNDPFDAALPFQYNESQITDENIFKKYVLLAKNNNPNLSEPELHTIAYEYQKRGFLKDPAYRETFIEWNIQRINEDFGILSLTSECNNFLMWSHYSNSHSGFCVGFDKYLLFEQVGSITKVIYEDQFPVINLFEDPIDYILKLTCIKSKKLWEYENEYRAVKSNFSRKKLILKPETYKEIIFGCNMSQKTKFELIQSLPKIFPRIKIYETVKNKKEFKLDVAPLIV
jgi:hypothetical protein